jgi:hypothetical protein
LGRVEADGRVELPRAVTSRGRKELGRDLAWGGKDGAGWSSWKGKMELVWSWYGADGREFGCRDGAEEVEDGTRMELRERSMGQGWS